MKFVEHNLYPVLFTTKAQRSEVKLILFLVPSCLRSDYLAPACFLKDPIKNIIDLLECMREVETTVDLLAAQVPADILIVLQQLFEIVALFPYLHGVPLHKGVGGLTGDALAHERKHHGL
jgi:hypothetical protein